MSVLCRSLFGLLLALDLAACGSDGGPSPTPTVTLSAASSQVVHGSATSLSWSSTNAATCVASEGWSGIKATSGTESVGALTAAKRFSLTCSGLGGTASASVIVAVTPAPPVLPAWLDALAIGEWFEIPETALSAVEPSPVPFGNSGPASKVIAWTSFVVDTRTSRVYSVANGGHSDYSGNEVDLLDIERERPAWRELLPPTSAANYTACSAYYADGRPTSRHTYYGVTFDELGDRIMLFGGSWSCDNGVPFLTTIDSYNIGANAYSAAGTHPQFPDIFSSVPAFSRDPATGDVYVNNFRTLGRWSRSTNEFAILSPTGSEISWGYQAMSAFDSSRGRILFLGGQNADRHIYTPSANAFTQVTLKGSLSSYVAAAEGHAMFYVPTLDRYLIRGDGAGGTIYQVHPSTFEITQFPTTSGVAVPSTENGPYNKFLYVPRLGGAVYVPTYFGNAWFLRLHAGPGAPAMSGVTGSVDSSLLNRHREGVNLVYAFAGFRTTSGNPVATAPVVQNSGGCTFSYELRGLPDGNYTVALTSDGGTSFSRSTDVTISGTLAVQDFVPVNVVRVGPGRMFAHPNDVADIVQNGDVVELDAGTYPDVESVWTAGNLTLRGVGGRAQLVAPANISNQKAIWVTRGANIAVENIEFSNAAVPDLNGAGIRAEGRDLAICGSYFHDNENGILGNASNGNVLVEYSEFAHNGHCIDLCAHNMYIGNTDRFTLRHSYSHHAHSGHLVKSRAKENYILYNRLMDEESGDSSYVVDLPNGGLSYVIGNLLQQGPNTENSTILTYGAEGLTNPNHTLYVVNNTFVNDYGSGAFIRVQGGSTATVRNNLFVGNGTPVSGTAAQFTNLQTNQPNFVNIGSYDYRPTAATPGVDQGSTPGSGGVFDLTPVYQYLHRVDREPRPSRNGIDVGAYEFGR